MTQQPTGTQPGLNLGDIYYVLFRHKWKIILCSLIGFGAALATYRIAPPMYQSEAKLLVRYVISESRITGPNANSATSRILTDERGASIMATEREILRSLDLAREVAAAIGPERILARVGGGADLGMAIKVLRERLEVVVPQGSSVIHISFGHPDPQIVQPVLREIIDQYLKLHVTTHRASGMLTDTLAQEADTLRSRLAQTEDDLRRTTTRAGVISLEGAKEAYSSQLTAIRREVFNYEAELAAQLAVFEEIRKQEPTAKFKPGDLTNAEIPTTVIDQYRALSSRLNRFQSIEQELSVHFKPESLRVQEVQAQIKEVESDLQNLREKYPQLQHVNTPSVAKTSVNPFADEAASAWLKITSHQAKIKELNSQYERVRAEVTKLEQIEGTILELRRKKELDESNYRFYAANREQHRISEALGNGKVSNISQIQAPSPPFREIINFKKPALILLGGIVTGLAWAFLIELYFDRSVRRPADLSRIARLPLFLTIPKLQLKALASNTESRAPLELSGSRPNPTLTSQSDSATSNFSPTALLPFHETLRDRLIGFFESKNLTHKPKLVAVTGLLSEAGVTTTAAGLARRLSETGEGSVLLVDMTVGQGAAQQFLKGKAVCDIDDLLEARSQAHVQERLYVVAESNGSDRLSRSLPKRFASLVPKLKSSDFDYIIFDMPPVSQVSITPRLASFMDMVLLVIESEKTDRELVEGACMLLAESKTHVGVVLNKTRSYVPSRLQQELLAS